MWWSRNRAHRLLVVGKDSVARNYGTRLSCLWSMCLLGMAVPHLILAG